MAGKKKNVPKAVPERIGNAVAPAMAEDPSENSPEEELVAEPLAKEEPVEVSQENPSPADDDLNEEEYQDAVAAILARKRRILDARKESEGEQSPAAEPKTEKPRSDNAIPKNDSSAGEETTEAAAGLEGEAEEQPLPVPNDLPGQEETIKATAGRDGEEEGESVPATDDSLASNIAQAEPLAGADANREDAPPLEAASPATAAPRFDRTPAGVGVGAIIVFVGVALLSAILMGAALSYRYERTQRELMTQLTQTLDSLKEPAATAPGPATAVEEPKLDIPKTYDDYALVLNEANALFNASRFSDAAEKYRSALTAFPSGSLSDQAHYRLGVSLLRASLPEKAAEHFRVVTESFPGSPYSARSALELSNIFIQREEYEQARRVLYRIIGSRANLAGEDAKTLEKAYYALGRTLEGEATVAERIRTEHKIDLNSESNTGDRP